MSGHTLKLTAGLAQAQERGVNGRNRAHDRAFVGIPDSPFLKLDEAARIARLEDSKNPAEAFLVKAKRAGLPLGKFGKTVLVDRRELEAAIRAGVL